MRLIKPSDSCFLLILGAISLFSYVAVSLSLNSDVLGSHSDSLYYKLWINESFRYASSPIDVSVISPVQGLGGLTPPIGVWLHPGHLPGFLVGHMIEPNVVNGIVGVVMYFTATFLLGRAVGLRTCPAIVAGQIPAIICFPPISVLFWQFSFYISSYYSCSPALAFPVVLGTFLIVVFLVLGSCRRATNIVGMLALPAIVIYSVACDPLYTSVCFVAPGFFLLCTMLIDSRDRHVVHWRLAGLATCFVVCLAASLPRLYWAYSNYSARVVFPNEIHGGFQNFQQGAMLFQGLGNATFIVVLIFSCVLLCLFGTRREKSLGCSILVFQVFMIGLTLVFVFSGIRWTLPDPAYFEQGALPAYFVAIPLGMQVGWPKIQASFEMRVARILRPVKESRWPSYLANASVVLLPVLATLIVGLRSIDARSGPQEVSFPEGSLVHIVSKELSPGQDNEFHGSVVTVAGIPGGRIAGQLRIAYDAPRSEESYNLTNAYLTQTFDPNLGIRHLWNLGIPTLEHNSQLITTQRYYLFSRALARPVDYQFTNYSLVSVIRPKLMAAMGARYLMSDVHYANEPLLTIRGRQINDEGLSLWLYEIAKPNTGNYSPTQVRIAKTAREMIDLMIADEFSFEDEVILHSQIDGLTTLVRATAGRMYFERGGVRVTADSGGTSLLVLPLEFSHSLRVLTSQSDSQHLRLLRVNLLQTGVLFSGALDIKIGHVFGLFRDTHGRLLDIEDCESLGMIETGDRPYPKHRMPYALKGD